MHRRYLMGMAATGLSLLAGVAGAVAPAAASAKSRTHATATRYYLALGDSLSVGYQPNAQGVGIETDQGYTNDLYTKLHARDHNLKLVELGCPGDTTTSMLTGKGNTTAAKAYHCNRSGGSQLAAAVAFLKAHHQAGEVPYLTLDIGANDVDGCAADAAQGLSAVETCVGTGVSTIEHNTPKILAALAKAAPKGTTTTAMNLYDPVLADELSTDASSQQLGQLSIGLVQGINEAIAKADHAAHFLTADVADAFDTYDTTPESTTGTVLASSGLSSAPTDVVDICALTWMCAPAPVGPNIHANATGYQDIASAFEAVLFPTQAGATR